jgi:very-short-patch-repair endonuclease
MAFTFAGNTPSGHILPIFPLKGMICSPKAKLIIELDGSQHLEEEEYDTERSALLESKGYRVLRFWNNNVMNNIENVVGVILEELSSAGILTIKERK